MALFNSFYGYVTDLLLRCPCPLSGQLLSEAHDWSHPIRSVQAAFPRISTISLLTSQGLAHLPWSHRSANLLDQSHHLHVSCNITGASGAHSVTLSVSNTPALPPPTFYPVWLHPLRPASLKNRAWIPLGIPSPSAAIHRDLFYHFLPCWLCDKHSAYNARDPGLIPGSGRSPGGGNGNPLQYSCLENPMDEGAL